MTAAVGASSDGHADVSCPSLLINTLAMVDDITAPVATVWTSSDGTLTSVARRYCMDYQQRAVDITASIAGSLYSSDGQWCAHRYCGCSHGHFACYSGHLLQ
jgi:hypothetical protein